MVRQFDLVALLHATPSATRTRIMIGINTKSILNRRILQRQIRQALVTQSMMAMEMGIAAIPMQAPHATPAVLALRSMALTTVQDRHLPVPAADLDHRHLHIPDRHLARVRPVQDLRALPRLPVPLLRVRTLRRTQATARLDQAPVLRRSRLRLNLRPRRRIPAEAVVRHDK